MSKIKRRYVDCRNGKRVSHTVLHGLYRNPHSFTGCTISHTTTALKLHMHLRAPHIPKGCRRSHLLRHCTAPQTSTGCEDPRTVGCTALDPTSGLAPSHTSEIAGPKTSACSTYVYGLHSSTPLWALHRLAGIEVTIILLLLILILILHLLLQLDVCLARDEDQQRGPSSKGVGAPALPRGFVIVLPQVAALSVLSHEVA